MTAMSCVSKYVTFKKSHLALSFTFLAVEDIFIGQRLILVLIALLLRSYLFSFDFFRRNIQEKKTQERYSSLQNR